MICYTHTHTCTMSPCRHTQPPPIHQQTHEQGRWQTDRPIDIYTDAQTDAQTCWHTLQRHACVWVRVRGWYNLWHDAVSPLRLVSPFLWFPLLPFLNPSFLHLVSTVTTASLFVNLQRYVYSILLTHVQYSTLAVHQECPYCAWSRTLQPFNSNQPHTSCTAYSISFPCWAINHKIRN